jgi:Glycosyltransferase like family
MTRPHTSISIVCVYNNAAVREQCLDRSIRSLAHEAPGVEYLPIDNTDHAYPSAGAALNHGASLAKNDVVVFVHQDVFLHSLRKLQAAAGMLAEGGFGVLGAVGVRSDGLLLGRIRDRVLLAGEPVTTPGDVDSVDEVLFLAPREQLLADPLTQSPDLAWHAYAVEYGCRMRRKGLRVGVADIPLTHNSLSVNLARLSEAHQVVAELYSDLLPVMTTCGRISDRKASPVARGGWLADQRWRYRWLRSSMKLQRAGAGGRRMPGVLADIRYDVDQLIARAPGQRLHIVNCTDGRPFAHLDDEPLGLRRRDGDVHFSDCDVSQVNSFIANCSPDAWVLVTNLSPVNMQLLKRQLVIGAGTLGFHMGTGLWLLIGPSVEELPEGWRSRRATPLGARPLVAAS